MSALWIHIFVTVIHGKHFVTTISLMLVFIILKYLHSYFVRFQTRRSPMYCGVGRSLQRGIPLFCAVRIRHGRRVNMLWLVWNIWWETSINSSYRNEIMSGLCKIISASTGYKRSLNQFRVCVCIFRYLVKSGPCIGNYHCGVGTLVQSGRLVWYSWLLN